MTIQLAKLNKLALTLDINQFYVVTFRNDQITLQGIIKKETIKSLHDAGYVLTTNVEGWLEYNTDELRIVLT
jgi:hypothetical protein